MKKDVLLYCHQKSHSSKQIRETLPLSLSHYNIHYNDIYGSSDQDILIDLSKRTYSDAFLNKHYSKYDIIYMVNCPYSVYTNTREYILKLSLFKNIYKLLNPSGILILGFAVKAVKCITKKNLPLRSIYHLNNIENPKEKEYYHKVNMRNLKVHLDVYKILRKMIKDILATNSIGLQLLSAKKNKFHIKYPTSPYENIAETFVFQKV